MNKRTFQALKDSIEKWRQIERGEMADVHGNCALCLEYLYGVNGSCHGCPVMQNTGLSICRGTPYEKWDDLQMRHDEDALWGAEEAVWVADTPQLIRIARAERKFLESLLP